MISALVGTVGIAISLGIPGQPASVDQHLVFMTDCSISMVARRSEKELKAEAEIARSKAKAILEYVKERPDAKRIKVSFWRFGDKMRRVPLGDKQRGLHYHRYGPAGKVRATGLSPASALELLGDFFSVEAQKRRGCYKDRYTYLSQSIVRVVSQLLNSGWSPADAWLPRIDRGAATVQVYVFTDNEEDVHPKDKETNIRYQNWVACYENGAMQLAIQKWTYFKPNTVLRAQQEKSIAPPPGDRITYDVRLGLLSWAAHTDLRVMKGSNLSLELPREIRLVPRMSPLATLKALRKKPDRKLIGCDKEYGKPGSGGQQTLRAAAKAAERSLTVKERSAFACRRQAQSTSVESSKAKTVSVQPVVDWSPTPHAKKTTGTWWLSLPSREVIRSPHKSPSATGASRRGGSRKIVAKELRLSFKGELSAVLPSKKLADGIYSVLLPREALCRELKAQYPNSNFLFPPDSTILGLIRVENSIVFILSTASGGPPDATMSLTADSLHVYGRKQRRLLVTGPSAAAAGVTFDLSFKNSAYAAQLATLAGRGGLSKRREVRVGAPVRISTPPHSQSWMDGLPFLERGFQVPAGRYQGHLCVKVRAKSTGAGVPAILLKCPNCSGKHVGSDRSKYCIPLVIEVAPKGWYGPFVVLLSLLLMTLCYVSFRWKTRPRWAPELKVGILPRGRDIATHAAHVSGTAIKAYRRRPILLELWPDAGTDVSGKPQGEPDKCEGLKALLEIKPSAQGISFRCVWAATGAQVSEVRSGIALWPMQVDQDEAGPIWRSFGPPGPWTLLVEETTENTPEMTEYEITFGPQDASET